MHANRFLTMFGIPHCYKEQAKLQHQTVQYGIVGTKAKCRVSFVILQFVKLEI